ncbi:Glucose/arabinose dehydrogenase, beta-propeller fold [Rhodovulum sp. ES.010]|uniref:PQQ-dependent sugar dehydrogenase n=1 Tax=Rhodovulum sp. ES.010 TaxID=1882821 RepID=UPI000929FA82|nr:PQQ-dependent sugar dehydrogenase [Rhodovulum sp. ES.010]SIO19578.1 Glucose/arabinose dehydrogenase, beta-propeller fold [Rhodovulum sp. ES.010]
MKTVCTSLLGLAGLALVALATPPARALDSSTGPLRIERVAGELIEPWAVAFLPGGGLLVTERGGRLWHIAGGKRTDVAGVPSVAAVGQGGLLDVMVPRDFAESREVFLSYAKAQGRGEGTALGVGRLSADGARLEGFREIFEMAPGARGGRHFGSRIVEGPDGHLFVTIGERGDRPSAQDLGQHKGSVIRLNRDGSVPADNPFVALAGAQPEIWSYGHRNPQGAALDLRGRLWVHEHGARGGDEVNRVEKGVNYGWPVISYGRHYSGATIGEGTEKAGMTQPAHYWDPSIAPSGLVVYSGALWPEWRGDFFAGSLNSDFISRLDPDAGFAEERLAAPQTGRVRDVAEGPDGAIWFLSVTNGALYRIVPD